VKPAATAPVKLVPLAELKAHPRNPRRHDRGEIDALKASILEYGFTEPLIRQQSSGHVVAGAGRLQAASELAEEGKLRAVEFTPGVKLNGRLPVVDKHLTDRQALAYCIADNRITERGTWDMAEVKDILVTDLGLTADVGSFDLPVGFDPPELQSLEAWTGKGDPLKVRVGKPGLTDDDAVPDAAPSRTKPGDVWLCGKHRVMCGDSTKAEDVKRLMAGGKADAVVTDPPYGVNYEGGASNARKRERLAGDDSAALYPAAFCAPVVYAWFSGCNAGDVFAACHRSGWSPRAVIVWRKLKPHYGAANADYKQAHELCLYAVRGASHFCGATNESTVWEIEQPRVNELHPTQKPVECMARPIQNHKAAKVYDPFLGSGTTLIACEKLDRVCYGCDIESRYVDVAVKRWQDFTGRKAVKERAKP